MKGKQRAYLRGLANGIDAKYQIGKNGVDESALAQFDEALEANELIKIAVLDNSLLTARECCDAVCEKIGAEPIQVIGKKFVIYKESKKHKTIVLPK